MKTLPHIDHLLFFGRFNIAHVGYLLVIKTGLSQLQPRCGITLFPSTDTPIWMQHTLPFRNRFAMLKEAIASEFPIAIQKQIHLSTLELTLHAQGKKSGFTIDVLRSFIDTHPQKALGIIMGADAALTLHKWKDYQVILQLSDVFIVPRATLMTAQQVHDNLPSELLFYTEGDDAKLHILSLPDQSMASYASSTQVLAGERAFLPKSVQSYAVTHGLLE